MDVDVLFARIPVSNFEEARAWYERFFDRAADVVAHENEVLWQVTDRAWLYIVRDEEHAGKTVVAMAVADVEAVRVALDGRGIGAGTIEPEGDAGRKSVVHDPDGNSIEVLEVFEV